MNTRRYRWSTLIWLPVVVIFGVAREAAAQSIGDLLPIAVPGFSVAAGVTVQSRLHHEDAPTGVNLGPAAGDLLIFPSVTATAGIDGTPASGKPASPLLRAEPAIRFTDPPLGLIGFVGADLTRYTSDPNADSSDITAVLGLVEPLGPDTATIGIARVATQETALGLAGSGSAAPFGVVLNDARFSLRLPLGQFDATERVELGQAVLSQTTPNQTRPNQIGTTTPLAFRNRTTLRASSEIATANDGVLRFLALIKASVAHYQGAARGDGFSDGNALTALGGVETAPDGILRLRVLAGAVTQHFAQASTTAGTTPIGSIGLGWTPDGLVSAEFDLTREAGIETTLGTPGTAVTSADLAIAEAYSRDLSLTATVAAREGSVARRQAREIDLAAGATWHVARGLAVVPSLSYAIRHNLPGSSPRETRAMIALAWTP